MVVLFLFETFKEVRGGSAKSLKAISESAQHSRDGLRPATEPPQLPSPPTRNKKLPNFVYIA